MEQCGIEAKRIRFATADDRNQWLNNCRSRKSRESGTATKTATIVLLGLTVLVLIGIVVEKKYGVFSPQTN